MRECRVLLHRLSNEDITNIKFNLSRPADTEFVLISSDDEARPATSALGSPTSDPLSTQKRKLVDLFEPETSPARARGRPPKRRNTNESPTATRRSTRTQNALLLSTPSRNTRASGVQPIGMSELSQKRSSRKGISKRSDDSVAVKVEGPPELDQMAESGVNESGDSGVDKTDESGEQKITEPEAKKTAKSEVYRNTRSKNSNPIKKESLKAESETKRGPKFVIKHADRTPKPSCSMPDLDNIPPLKLNLSWDNSKTKKSSNKGKRRKKTSHCGTQTDEKWKRGSNRVENQDLQHQVREILEQITTLTQGKTDGAPVFNFYFVHPSPLFKNYDVKKISKSATKEGSSVTESEFTLKVQTKAAKVPTGTKTAEPQPGPSNEPVSTNSDPTKNQSSSNPDPLAFLGIESLFTVPTFNPEPNSTNLETLSPSNQIERRISQLKKPMIPSGAVTSQPLWKSEDVNRLGKFNDRFDFPSKQHYILPAAQLSEEDQRIYNLNQLEKQQQDFLELRYKDEEEFQWLLDDLDEPALSDVSAADAEFSDEEEAKMSDEDELFSPVKKEQGTATEAIPEAAVEAKEAAEPPKEPELQKEPESAETNEIPEQTQNSGETQVEDDDAISISAGSMRSLSDSPTPEEAKNFVEEEPTPAQKLPAASQEEPPMNLACPRKPPISPIPSPPKVVVDLRCFQEQLPKTPAVPPRKFCSIPQPLSVQNRDWVMVASQKPSEEPYVQGFLDYFCKNFILRGTCGFRCSDLQCYKRMAAFSIPTFQQELKLLSTASVLRMYQHVKTSACLFNFFFPSFADVLGTRGLLKDLKDAISICEQENFNISNYKWVVQGLIRGKVAPEKALQLLLKNKTANSVEALETTLKIVIGAKLLEQYYFIVEECVKIPGFIFHPDWVNAIFAHLDSQALMEERHMLLLEVYVHKMTDEGRTGLSVHLMNFIREILNLSLQDFPPPVMENNNVEQVKGPTEPAYEMEEEKERPFRPPENLLWDDN